MEGPVSVVLWHQVKVWRIFTSDRHWKTWNQVSWTRCNHAFWSLWGGW